MELWPKKSAGDVKRRQEMKQLFEPPRFSEKERARHPHGLDDIDSPEAFVSAVDFDTINDIFDALVSKSAGASPIHSTGHRISAEKLVVEPLLESRGERVSGAATSSSGEIRLTWDERTENEHSAVRTLSALKTLMHEAAHVRSGYVSTRWEKEASLDSEWSTGFLHRTGLKETRYDSSLEPSKVSQGLSLNEAVTESIAQEVFHEYLLRTGNIGYLENDELKAQMSDGVESAYITDRLVLAAVMQSLAESLGVPRDQIWRGFVQAYMSASDDLPKLLEEIEHALSERPEMKELIAKLAAPKSLEIDDSFSINTLVASFESHYQERMERLSKAMDILNWVGGVKNKENLRNVLGLH